MSLNPADATQIVGIALATPYPFSWSWTIWGTRIAGETVPKLNPNTKAILKGNPNIH